jgi:hypothetical protein
MEGNLLRLSCCGIKHREGGFPTRAMTEHEALWVSVTRPFGPRSSNSIGNTIRQTKLFASALVLFLEMACERAPITAGGFDRGTGGFGFGAAASNARADPRDFLRSVASTQTVVFSPSGTTRSTLAP